MSNNSLSCVLNTFWLELDSRKFLYAFNFHVSKSFLILIFACMDIVYPKVENQIHVCLGMLCKRSFFKSYSQVSIRVY